MLRPVLRAPELIMAQRILPAQRGLYKFLFRLEQDTRSSAAARVEYDVENAGFIERVVPRDFNSIHDGNISSTRRK